MGRWTQQAALNSCYCLLLAAAVAACLLFAVAAAAACLLQSIAFNFFSHLKT